MAEQFGPTLPVIDGCVQLCRAAALHHQRSKDRVAKGHIVQNRTGCINIGLIGEIREISGTFPIEVSRARDTGRLQEHVVVAVIPPARGTL